ncbi:hypothetical protein [Candidatus Nitrotoga sp. M5]|uniref:hypothetical protein n=1 Tax=Candidatus Nitrotoga sp. M5 TaxID=2890409 RepID=UPI001EF1D0FC|nr:hypothetical protein [Candidatus Nitrotoga sp. M5]CAH1386904.1 hypothetical protein NTGM5_40005 [Candidatus Nitrotoga sp. M5]
MLGYKSTDFSPEFKLFSGVGLPTDFEAERQASISLSFSHKIKELLIFSPSQSLYFL